MKLNDYAVRFGMEISNEVPFKNVEGFKVQLSEMQVGYVRQVMMVFTCNRMLSTNDQKVIRKSIGLGGMYVKSVGLANNAIFVPVAKNMKPEVFDNKVSKIVLALNGLDIKDLNYCPFCGSAEELDGIRNVEGVNIDVHNHCVEEFLEKAENELTAHESGSYLKGLLYGLGGALLGSIPSIISLFGFGFYSAWLFLIIPLVSFWLYKKSGSPKTMIAVIYVAIVSVIISELIGLLYYAALLQTLGATFEALFADAEYRGYFITDMSMILLFSLLGVFIAWNFMYKTTSQAMRKNLSQYKK
ncbi:MAG: hypothetical protein AB7E61_07610 [Acholeplasmataceae bacterium]